MDTIVEVKPETDGARAEAFFGRITTVLENGALAVMLSIGHRTGLLDCMAKRLPSTSSEIAKAAGLSERYVREWLAVLTTSKVVDYCAGDQTYSLPPEHAACLTRSARLGNMSVYAQFVAEAGAMQERVIQSFQTGQGIEYGEYPCFHKIMAEDSGQTVAAGIEQILNDLVPDLLPRLSDGIDVLDAGCGAGRAITKMAELFPNSRFHGYDLCGDAIDMAKAEAVQRNIDNVTFKVLDLASLDAVGTFDLITSFDAVHDTPGPAAVLMSFAGALRPGGVHLMQDIGGSARLENNLDFPFAPFLYAISCMHCTPVSLAQGGEGLGAMWGWETAERMLRQAGFDQIDRTILPHDPMNVWFVSRRREG